MDMQRKRRRDLTILACLGAVGAAVIAIAVFGVPLRTLLLFGLIALCPLMHLFMGHGSHDHEASGTPQPVEQPVPSAPDQR